MAGAAKAWVNFNGNSTVTIRASFNVSSITDNGVGDYTVNFTTAMADANFAAVASSKNSDNIAHNRWYQTQACAFSTTSVRLLTASPTSGSVTDAAAADAALVNLSIFR